MFPRRAGSALIALFFASAAAPQSESLRFVIIGDRTGETQPGVYEEVWKEAAAEKPRFVVSVGDTIQGLTDSTADAEWQEVEKTLLAWKQFPLYLTPGNHDVWSAESAHLYEKYSGHPAHYSFDVDDAHFTILDNSRTEEFDAAELKFLQSDLAQHERAPVKFVVSHRPSWILKVVLNNPDFELHRIAKKYGVRYVIAGHVHEMLHADLDGITYISLPSAGGHLRGEGKYEDGWFFGYTTVDVHEGRATLRIQELGAPYGKARNTDLSAWGKAGLLNAR
jgi:3',5'-cyclic AMP phosphodiesterase CpdA